MRPRTTEIVCSTMRKLDKAVSAQEIYRLVHQRGDGLGLASIYRALDGLVAGGEAERLRRDTEDTYVLCPPAHHHHAICRECGRVDTLQTCTLQETQPSTTDRGFHIDTHQAVYYGRCSDCYVTCMGGDS